MRTFKNLMNINLMLRSLITAGQYNKLRRLAGSDIADVSQKKIIEIIHSNATNPNQISSLTNIAFLIRRMNKMPTEELVLARGMPSSVFTSPSSLSSSSLWTL